MGYSVRRAGFTSDWPAIACLRNRASIGDWPGGRIHGSSAVQRGLRGGGPRGSVKPLLPLKFCSMPPPSGAKGIGKTQLGLDFLNAGQRQEGRRGVVFDMSSRGDSQNHANYAAAHFDWPLRAMSAEPPPSPEQIWSADGELGDYLNLFQHTGQRVTQRDLGFDDWLNWKAELAKQLATAIFFFYGHFIRGVRRAVVDRMEPVA